MNTEKITVIKIDANLAKKIEALQVETRARQDLISFMMSNGSSMTTEQFTQYHDEYIAYHQEYEKAKQELQNTYVPADAKRWNLDFASGEVTIYA